MITAYEKLDCSVGGLYYKIYAEAHERRMAANVLIKPAHIGFGRNSWFHAWIFCL